MSWIWAPIAAALLDWLTLAKGWQRLQPVTKPAVPAAVALWILLATGTPTGPALWILTGVLFAFVGDILLLPKLDRFLPALGAFFLLHVAWIAGLNPSFPPINLSTVMLALAVLLPAVAVIRRVQVGMAERNIRPGVAAFVYAAALSGMVFSGLATLAREEWPPFPALLVASGAVLFVLSDVILIWDRFVAPLPRARLARRVMYHAGMVAVVLGGVVLSP